MAKAGSSSAASRSFGAAATSFFLPHSLLGRIYIAIFASTALTYVLFQKKLLPKPISKIVSKLFFLPTFPITALMRLGNYWTTIDDTAYLGCAPLAIVNHPAKLHKLGVRGVINMCYEYDGPKAAYAELGMKQLHLPVVDHFEPSVAQLQEAVAFIQECKLKGQKVYIHCKAGHGRAAAVALSWMMHETPEAGPEELNAMLRRKRRVRKTLFKQSSIQALYASMQQGKK
jgi:atypical dual specificity phosphatase